MPRLALRSAVVALSTLVLAACLAPPGSGAATDDGAGTGESDLTFHVGEVDRSLPDVDAIGYDVSIAVDDTHDHESYRASVTGTYVATRALDELRLDFAGNTIDSVTVNGRSARYRRDGDSLFVTVGSIADGATFKTRIRYHGDVLVADGQDANDLNAFGGFMLRRSNAEGKRIYTTLNWPHNGRRWLPLRDHPSDGAMLAITATFPRAYTVLANGKRTAKKDNPDGTTTWKYEELAPMPVYDFHLSAYDGWATDEAASASGVPIATYMYQDAHASQAKVYGDVHDALDWYEAHLGAYRWGSLGYIEEPIFGGGMENASVVSMDETVFEDLADARDIAFHELAHHWSGNLVRARTWNDFWLSEGFTEYEKARFVADHDGPSAEKKVWRGYLTEALAADRDAPHPVRPPDPEVDVLGIFDAISYQKGALCLRQLERVTGSAQMLEFLKGWFDRHAFQAVTTRQFEDELSEATGEDLSKLFDGFVYGEGHPEVKVTAAPAGAGGDVDVRVEQVQRGGPSGGFAFPLDVDLTDASGVVTRVTIDVTGKTASKRVALGSAPKSVVVDPDEYLLGTVVCDASAPCKEGFRCASGTGAAKVCVPR
jgi:aminopeptidase N